MATVYPAARNLCAAATYEGRARTRTRASKNKREVYSSLTRQTEQDSPISRSLASNSARDGPPSEGAATRRCTR
eukprot:scaffold937_cov62-Phaeocystis_antarctica.AAC.2